MGFSTDCVHAGQEPEPTTGAVMTPIFATSTYAQRGGNVDGRYDYARVINPTRTALEKNLATLEGAQHGLCFGSGLASIDCLAHLLKAGDRVLVSENVYGGTFRMFDTIWEHHGLTFDWVDTSDLGKVEAALTPETRMVLVESPTNPMMTLTDIAGVSDLCGGRAILVVDNTFMSPYFQNPLKLGADVVTHSTTKYLNGHSDSIGGALLLNDDEVAARLRHIQKSVGAVLSPFESFLILRGVKTLALRMERHDKTGRRLADWLAERQDVQAVYYPGLKSHPQHALACKQMSGFGGMISFDVGTFAKARTILDRVEIFAAAESLGGVESLISHPASMTHASVPKDRAESLGLTEGLLRISCGVEDVEDLEEDLERAFAAS